MPPKRDVGLHILHLVAAVALVGHELPDIPQLDRAVFACAGEGAAVPRHELEAADDVHVRLERADGPELLLVGSVPRNVVVHLLVLAATRLLILLERRVCDALLQLVSREHLVRACLVDLHQAVVQLVGVSLLIFQTLVERSLHLLLGHSLAEPICRR